jgi:hypothetical protein
MSSENRRARAALAMIPRPKRTRVRGARDVYDLQQCQYSWMIDERSGVAGRAYDQKDIATNKI